MHKIKTMVLALASMSVCSLPLVAEETTNEITEPAAVSESAEGSASAMESMMAEREARWQARNERYRDLRERAEKLGVMLPEDPPWSGGGSMMPQRADMEERRRMHEKMMSMTPEEREQARLTHYQEMRERARQRGVEMPETPPWQQRQEKADEEWAKHQAVIEGMSDEQRAACHAMHRRHMGMMHSPGMRCGSDMRRGMGPGMMGPGHGYWQAPYGQKNFWDPNQ